MLLKFFILLATASETDLGFDTNIKRVGKTDYDVQFTIEGKDYCASSLLSDIGADTPSGQGTWVFEVTGKEKTKVHVIKDRWIEDRLGKQMEHQIVVEIKGDIDDDEEFHKHFIGICGYRRTDTSGWFSDICEVLKNPALMPGEHSEHFEFWLLVPAPSTQKPLYTGPGKASVADQGHLLHSTPTKPAPQNLPHPRFRYQVVYDERGISLFEVTLFVDAFIYLGQAAGGMWQDVVNRQTSSCFELSAISPTPSRVGT